MKIKNKVLLGALGVTALTGGMLLTNQTQASASNEVVPYADVNRFESSGVLMATYEDLSFFVMWSYSDFMVTLDRDVNFKANHNYNLMVEIDVTEYYLQYIKLEMYNASGRLIKTIGYDSIDKSELLPGMIMQNKQLLTASISATEDFYIVLKSTETAQTPAVNSMGGLQDINIYSFIVEEVDSTAPVLTLGKTEYTIEVGNSYNNDHPGSVAQMFNPSATDDRDGVVDWYIKETNFDAMKVGRYYFVIGAKDSYGNESTQIGYCNVVDTQKPVINGWQGVYYTNFDSPTTLQNVLDKISAYDETAGAVPVSVVSDGYTGKTNVLGDHYVVLSATDGTNTTQITINIIVVDGTAPTISGPTALTSNMSSPLTESSIRAMLSASDNADTSLTIDLISDNFTANSQKAGSYTITYRTTDDSGNVSAIHTITITNKDDIKPVISGKTSINAGSSTKLSIDEIKTNLSVSDNIDSGLTINVVEDNYSNNYGQVGSHTITFNATDKSGNVSDIYTLTIVVSDTTKPVIAGTNAYTSNMSNPITEAQVRAGLTATDNVDENLTINLVADGFVGNEQKFGSFNIVYNVTDSAGNVSEDYIVVITTYDDIAPVITGKNEYSVSSIGKLNLDLVTKALDVSDNDGEVPTYEIVKDGYSNYTSIVGTYEVTYVARDSNGNESSPFVIKIHVVDNIPPVFFISEDILYVEDTLTLTHQQIIEGLLSQTNINTGMVAEYELETQYFGSPNVASVYSVKATVYMLDGSVNEVNGSIEVISTEDDENPVIDETDAQEQVEQRVNKFWEGALKTLKNIWEFFVKLFKTIIFGWLWDADGKFDPKWTEWN